MDAGFLNVVENGQYFMTKDTVCYAGFCWLRVTSRCVPFGRLLSRRMEKCLRVLELPEHLEI